MLERNLQSPRLAPEHEVAFGSIARGRPGGRHAIDAGRGLMTQTFSLKSFTAGAATAVSVMDFIV